jgi:hypothetical protein
MNIHKIILTAILILMVTAVSHAATLNYTYNNDNQTDYIYLFITSVEGADVDFVQWTSLPGGWVTDIHEAERLSAYGPTIDPGERFRIRFSERGTFTLEWAEMLSGVAQDQGSRYFVNGRFVSADDEFTSTIPTPIAGTYWLLGSGLIVLIGVRRRSKS